MDLFGAIERTSKSSSIPLSKRETGDFKEEKPLKKHKITLVPSIPTEDEKSTTRPEKLSFLPPCSICQGRYFTYGEKGGFFCNTCQPGITGSPAYAAGKERTKTRTTEPTETQAPLQKVVSEIGNTRQEEDCFKIGFPWIMEHLEELLATGWTRVELFKRSRHRWCIGNWGLAWAATWTRSDVNVAIEKSGRVSFTFKSGGRAITQAAYPVKMCKKRG